MTGETKPIASSTRSAFKVNSVPSIGFIFSSMRAHLRPVTTPFSPSKATVVTAKSRSAPSSWLEEVRSFKRPVRPGEQLVLGLRRHRHDLELGDLERALADRGADAVRAGVAAADDHDLLAGGEDRLVRADRLAGHAPVLLRQEVHREVNAARSRPGTGRSREASAPPASAIAS